MPTLDFSTPLYALAPLAGFTDLPFRSVVKKFGADFTVSEMISSNALAFKSKKTFKMLEKNELETPYSIQIAGSDLDIIRQAVELINERDGVDAIDLNCGCPAPKVVNNLQGSSLLTDLPRMSETIQTIKQYSNKEYTSVKMRLGFDSKNHVEIAKLCEDSGADYIAVHGRTKAGKYKATVDYDAIREIVKSVNIPVLANGDIDSPKKAKWVLEHTGAAGIMVGRGAVGKPWMFQLMKNFMRGEGSSEVSSALVQEVVLEHFDQMINHYGSHGAIIFRKHLHTYSKAGYEGASKFRDLVNRIEDVSEMRSLTQDFFGQEYAY
ncbi:MAG: tRNA dihydrouridine synthase B (EC [uncultured Sulfurovum sp.]|uniref:tRNA-dihydrouridine synthase n=1 Tax=uncultured Sulfurovum sp. TaxID=269237 RepID=A0A6S6S1C8_9BACT|nr:MAG: tRNA dihydrouridine synthase B (EC [uncultured Sulfurovum sp.]